jgi:hypothetical protein
MMSRILGAFLLCWLAADLKTSVQVGTIEVSLKTLPSTALPTPSIVPVVSDGDRPLKGIERSEAWSFRIEPRDKLLWALAIKLSAAAPADYEYGSLIAYIPYNKALSAKHVERVVLEVVRTGHEADDALRIWNRDVQAMSRESLLEIYQQARVIAFGRMADVNGKWSTLDDYDVVSVYKYLETVVALAKIASIAPPDNDVNHVREWFADALKNRKGQVYRALRSRVLAESLLPAVDDIEGARLAKLWNTILLEPLPRRCHLLEKYDELLRDSGTSVPGIDVGHVAAAIGQCRVKAGHGAKLPAAVAAAIIRRDKEAEKATTSAEMKARLRSDIATISELSEKPPPRE